MERDASTTAKKTLTSYNTNESHCLNQTSRAEQFTLRVLWVKQHSATYLHVAFEPLLQKPYLSRLTGELTSCRFCSLQRLRMW
jgi:hypothetical protein